MSLQYELEKPASLLSYLKQEISIEEIRDFSSPQRIVSIDFVKGFAIVMIILAHSASAWLNEEWMFMYGILFALLDILGPSLFCFLSALSVIFSIKRRVGLMPEKVIRGRIFSRGFVIIFIGFFYNLLSLATTYPFPFNLWGWNILMFIGFTQIFSYYALKLNKLRRVVVGMLIIGFSQIIRDALYIWKDLNPFIWILHYIIISPAPHVTLLPWLSICFLSTIFGEYLYDAMIKGTEDAYVGLFRIFMVWGIIIAIGGIVLGWQLVTEDTILGGLAEYPHLVLLNVANQQDFIEFPGMPMFLIRGTASSMLYNLGAALIIIAISFYFIDLKKKKNEFTGIMIYFGKVSLSLFLVHYTFLFLYMGQFDVVFFLLVGLSYLAFMGIFMYIWMEFFNGVGSPEWIMVQIGRIGQKTGETVKKEGKIIVKKTKERFKKTEVFLKSLSKEEE
ncbi:MAG: heparan-alpha-glucosaminide N-acetyltransferase domain-containing protein [Promethearchaeota archaeon]